MIYISGKFDLTMIGGQENYTIRAETVSINEVVQSLKGNKMQGCWMYAADFGELEMTRLVLGAGLSLFGDSTPIILSPHDCLYVAPMAEWYKEETTPEQVRRFKWLRVHVS